MIWAQPPPWSRCCVTWLGGFEQAANWVGKNSKKSSGTLDYWKLLAGADSSKHEIVNPMKSVRIVLQLAPDAVRWLEDKHALQQQQQKQLLTRNNNNVMMIVAYSACKFFNHLTLQSNIKQENWCVLHRLVKLLQESSSPCEADDTCNKCSFLKP